MNFNTTISINLSQHSKNIFPKSRVNLLGSQLRYMLRYDIFDFEKFCPKILHCKKTPSKFLVKRLFDFY